MHLYACWLSSLITQLQFTHWSQHVCRLTDEIDLHYNQTDFLHFAETTINRHQKQRNETTKSTASERVNSFN